MSASEPSNAIHVRPLGPLSPTPGTRFGLDPSKLRRRTGEIPPSLRSRVERYLRAGTIIFAFMEHTTDVLEGRFGVAGGSAVATDGRFYWRYEAADYVAHYGIGIDLSALKHMRSRDWQAPALSSAATLAIDSYLEQHFGLRPVAPDAALPSEWPRE